MNPGGPHPERQADTARPAIADRFGRVKRKLRVSLTDRCNYRCVYCMPECPVWKPRADILRFEELHALVGFFVRRLGIEQVRLTGGEPLVRRGVAGFVRMLADLRASGLNRVSLSSNGVMLARFAGALARAGLDDVNVSLDAISPALFSRMTGGGQVRDVLRGIEAARKAGLRVKLNAVVIRGMNQDEIVPLTEFAVSEDLPLRFIEFMPLDGRGFWSADKVVTEREILALVCERFEVSATERTNEPASYYLLDSKFQLGIIATVSNPFCARCDRVRLTADGRVFSCLFAPAGVDLREALARSAGGAESLDSLVREAIWNKPAGFIELRGRGEVSMNVLGG
jgi:cyclic pyranopterin phosphate synthase